MISKLKNWAGSNTINQISEIKRRGKARWRVGVTKYNFFFVNLV